MDEKPMDLKSADVPHWVMRFHIQQKGKQILLCGLSIRRGKTETAHSYFPADRVTQQILDDPRTCPTCIESYKGGEIND